MKRIRICLRSNLLRRTQEAADDLQQPAAKPPVQRPRTEKIRRRTGETVFAPDPEKEAAVGMFPAGTVQIMLIHLRQGAFPEFQGSRGTQQGRAALRIDQQRGDTRIVIPFRHERGKTPIVGDRQVRSAPHPGERTTRTRAAAV